MLKKIKTKIKCKRGEISYSTILLIVIILMVFYILITSLELYMSINNIQKTAQRVLDSYVVKMSQSSVQSIKSRSDYSSTLLSGFAEDFESKIGTFNKYEGTKGYYQISDVVTDYNVDKTLKIKAYYHLYKPIYFLGLEVTAFDKDMIVYSKNNIK